MRLTFASGGGDTGPAAQAGALRPACDTDTLKRAVKVSPGATVRGERRRASAGAVIGSKQMRSSTSGAKICVNG
jgi:hypothetical protein